MQCNFGQCSKNEVSHECFCGVPVQFWKSSFFMLAKPNKLSVVCLLEQFIHWTLWLCELQYFINFCFLLHKDLSFRFLQKLDTEVNNGQSKESVYTWIKAVRPITREAKEGGKEGDRKEAQLQKQIITGQVGEGPAWCAEQEDECERGGCSLQSPEINSPWQALLSKKYGSDTLNGSLLKTNIKNSYRYLL